MSAHPNKVRSKSRYRTQRSNRGAAASSNARLLLQWLGGTAFVVTTGVHALATERSCGADPLVNTANVLCLAPSGPCTASQVTLGGNLEVRSGGCEFDLGGRSLVVTKTFQMIGTGFILVENAGHITVTATGKLKTRGDFVLANGEITQGGRIQLVSSGSLTIAGRIETTGDGAGAIELRAPGAVRLESSGVIQGNGISSSVEEGDRFADGGQLSAASLTNDIILNGQIYLNGQNHGAGGALHLEAARRIEVNQAIEVTGGAGGGGDVDLRAGDNVTITRPIDVDSRSGGGEGGSIAIEAGTDELGGQLAGGSILIDNTRLELNGSAPDGDGGELDLVALGAIQVLGANSALRAGAGPTSAGSGGDVSLRSGDADLSVVGPSDGDVLVEGQIQAQGGSTGGDGGRLELVSGRNLFVDASTDVTSRIRGGVVQLSAAGDVSIDEPINAQASIASGVGGSVSITAGLSQNATLMVARDIRAATGANSGRRQSISLTSCTLIVENGVQIDGRGGIGPNGALGGATMRLAARDAIQLRGNSQYLATPDGHIAVVRPASVVPAISSGTVFNPPRTDDTTSPLPFPKCGS